MELALTLFAGLALFVSAVVLGLAFYTRPQEEPPSCSGCFSRAGGQCRVDGSFCHDQRLPGPRWVPIVFTGRCGPRGRFFVPR